MNPELLFRVSGNLALTGWLLLAFFPRRRWAAPLVAGVLVPGLLSCVYLGLLATHHGGAGNFSSLAGVAQLFADPWVLLAGWVHYLAFDLFIESWEVRDASRAGIAHWMVIPCLVLTFLLGPIGLLAYLGLRFARTRKVAVAAD